MKKKSIFLIIILLFLGIFAEFRFRHYPKKIVAEVLYTIDDRIFDFADNYFEKVGVRDIFYKVKSTGDYGIRLSAKKTSGDKLNIIDFESATNKSRYFLKRVERDNKVKKSGEKIVNNNVYLYLPYISEKTLFVDRNTMLSLSEDSDALKDLGYDINNEKLFAPPVSFSEKNTELKKYVKKEWTKIIRTTRVKNISENKFEVKVKSKDLQNLMKKTKEFYSLEDNFFYNYYLTRILEREFANISHDLKNRKNIIFYLETDEDSDLFKMHSEDNRYTLIVGDTLELRVPNRYIYVEREENEKLNTIKGKIDDRNFRMSYYPEEKKLIYHDEKMKFESRIFDLTRAKSFKVISDIEGSKFRKLNFNFYTVPKKIEKESDYIEILKLDRDDWQNLIKGEENEKWF